MTRYFNKNLKFIRQQKHISQQDLADKLNLDRSTISRWENNEMDVTVGNAIQVANFFNIPFEDLTRKDLTIIDDLQEITKDNLDEPSLLDNVLYTHKDKISSARNLPIKKQEAIASIVKSALDMIDDEGSNQ